jgi:membrane protein DedA with SNARE-associated domain
LVNVPALVGVALGTLVSEDLATIGAGGLVSAGQSSFWAAAAACVLGVWLGDQALWLAGRVLGRRVLRLPVVASRVSAEAVAQAAERLDANLGVAVIGSRFVPGSRLPMYLAAGVAGRRPLAFSLCSLLAVSLWSPLLLWASLRFGSALTALVVDEANAVVPQLLGGLLLLVAARGACARLSARSVVKAPNRWGETAEPTALAGSR